MSSLQVYLSSHVSHRVMLKAHAAITTSSISPPMRLPKNSSVFFGKEHVIRLYCMNTRGCDQVPLLFLPNRYTPRQGGKVKWGFSYPWYISTIWKLKRNCEEKYLRKLTITFPFKLCLNGIIKIYRWKQKKDFQVLPAANEWELQGVDYVMKPSYMAWKCSV